MSKRSERELLFKAYETRDRRKIRNRIYRTQRTYVNLIKANGAGGLVLEGCREFLKCLT